MKPKDAIQLFRQIRPLTNNRNIYGFIKSIEIIMDFFEDNSELIKNGVRIIINEKMIADFEAHIRQLGNVSWEQYFIKSQYFTMLDLPKGFHQILVKEDCKKHSFFNAFRAL